MGCGPGGSYLYRLLQQKKPKPEVVLFDIPHHTACGVKGCAWGVSWPQFVELCREAGVSGGKYLLGNYDHVLINQLKIRAEVAIVDKPSLIKDLLAGKSPLNPSGAQLDAFDHIVDATGAQRAYLSPWSNRPIVAAVQMRITPKESAPCPMVFLNNTGYTWLFPLSQGEAHVGALSHEGAEVAWQEIERVKQSLDARQVICSCTGQIRCHGPVLPFTEGKVWGLGEAIGLVDPISGAGIVPAMTSAKLMVENWESAPDYEMQVWRRYSYMVKEAGAMSRAMAGERPSYRDMLLPRRAFKTIGVKPSLPQVASAMLKARKWPYNR